MLLYYAIMNRLKLIPHQHYAWYLVAIWALLSLPSLGLAPLFDYDETIYAQTAADMMHLGEWIVPTANGLQFFEKPPFTYYMMDACFILFGENSFAARLPSALFTLFTAILLFRFGRDYHSPQLGITAALIFLSMFEVALLGHAAILDAVLNFFIAACLLNYLRWLQSADKRHALWCAAMMGLAVSIKGPVGAVVPLLIIFSERMLAGELFNTLKRIPWLAALALFLITATPWYLMILFEHGPAFLYEFIVVQNIGRAMNPMQGHGGGWHYYIVVFAVSVLPWLAMMPWLVRHWQRTSTQPLDHLIRLALLWSIIVIVLFSFAQTKLPHYISCLYPAIALAIAAAWWRNPATEQQIRRIHRISSLILLPVAILLIAFPLIYSEFTQFIHHPRAIAILTQDIQPSFWISFAGSLLLLALFWLWFKRETLYCFIVVGFILQTALLIPLGSFAGKLAQGPQNNIAHSIKELSPNIAIFSYNLNFPSISFKSGRSYHILLNQKGIEELQQQKAAHAIMLRSESLKHLPWLQKLTPAVNQGGFLFYIIQANELQQ